MTEENETTSEQAPANETPQAAEQAEPVQTPMPESTVPEDHTATSEEVPAVEIPGPRRVRQFDWNRAATLVGGALIVALAWAILDLWGLGRAPFHTKGEPREALVVWEIVNGGGWILPRRNGIELPSKPPMFHWLGALASIASGRTDEWSIRLPSAALGGATALIVFFVGASFWGARAGLFAALALLTCFEWARSGTSARVDMTLAFGLTLSFIGLLLLRRNERTLWRAMFYAGMGWAVLAKGALAGVIPPMLLVLLLCLADRSVVILRRLTLARGLLAVFLITGAWYGLAIREGGQAFVTKQIWFENVLRVTGGSHYGGGHLHSAARLVLELLLGLLPWSLLLPIALHQLWTPRHEDQQQSPRVFLLAWILAVLLPYTLASSKRGVYLLPLYPAFCLLLGASLNSLLPVGESFKKLRRILIPLSWTAAVAVGLTTLAVLGELGGVPVFAWLAGSVSGKTVTSVAAVAGSVPAHGALWLFSLLVAAVGAVTIAAAARAGRWGLVFSGLFVLSAGFVVIVRNAVLPAVAWEETRKPYAETVREIVGDADRLSAYRDFDYGFVFYWGRHLPVYDKSLTAKAPEYLLTNQTDWGDVDPVQRARYEPVPAGRSNPSANVGRLFLIRRVLREAAADSDGTPAEGVVP
jgi:4-amino-4-deoxy-L-arabinose transferase-like glycosyltransferase